MPTIQFHGFVSPTGVIGRSSGGPNTFRETGVDGVKFSFSIDDSTVWIECESSDIDRVAFNLLHMVSYCMVRGVLDAMSFAHALSMTLALDGCTKSRGKRVPLLIQEPELAKLCTVPHAEIIKLAGVERAILKHLHERNDALLHTLDSEANCAKAVEGFAQLLLPGSKAKQRWEKLRAALNLTESYVQPISDASTGPRHGAIEPQSPALISELRRRSWTVANRFLEFRKRGSVNLSNPDFPLL
jgi:hypothetical protein